MIVIDGLSKSYNENTVLNNISLHIFKGECVGLVGLNGVGKTTLINILLGKLRSDSGLIRVFGQESLELRRDVLKKIGFVSSTHSQLWQDMKLKYSFDNCAKMYNVSARDYKIILKKLCSALGIYELLHTEPQQMSLGQRMKCELAYALLPCPELLILDEATIGIDVAAKEELLRFIDDMRKQNGITIIYSGHYLNEVERICDRIIVLHNKEILFDGAIRKFIGEYSAFCTLILKCSSLPDFEDLPIEKYTVSDRKITIEFNRQKITSAEIIRHIQNVKPPCRILEMKIIESNLEDTIKKIYAKESNKKND